MMTEEHIKEAISLKYIELIAAFNGFKTKTSHPDYGTDLEIVEVGYRIEKDQMRYSDTGRELKFQLKATTENSIVYENDIVKYDLEAKSFNDLIARRNSKNPLLLLLFILPHKSTEWVNISDKELIARRCAYWYFPELKDIPTDNSASKRISISKENLISSETLNLLFEKYS